MEASVVLTVTMMVIVLLLNFVSTRLREKQEKLGEEK